MFADDDSYDILFCFEEGLLGFSQDLFEPELKGIDVELHELGSLPLFKNRLYFPVWIAKTIAVNQPNLASCLSQLYEFWQVECASRFNTNQSAKKTVLHLLAEYGYQSPFGVN